MKLRCDLINTKLIWFRTNRDAGTLELFIFKQPFGKHCQLVFGIWRFGFRLSINPFLGHTFFEIGKRFSNIPFFKIKVIRSESTF